MRTKNFSKNSNKTIDKGQIRYYNKSNTNNKNYFKHIHNYFYNKHYIKSLNHSVKIKIHSFQSNNKKHPINNEHDKIFRTVLSNKKDACKFINSIINFKSEITENDLELYKTNFVTSEFKNKEADIVYKLKDKSIFFLIEHQTKIDYTMPYRILSYQHEIIRSSINISKINTKNYTWPIVIPIVLYTGKIRWNAKTSLTNTQSDDSILPLSNYYLVDINDYSIETLLKDDLLISKLMILEKSKTNEELANNLELIIPRIKKEDRNFITNIINLILERKIGKTKAKENINKLNGGEEKMLAFIEMLREEERNNIRKGIKIGKSRGIKLGEKRGIKLGQKMGEKRGLEKNKKDKMEIAKKLLARNFSIEEIAEITGLTKQELENQHL